MSISVEEGRRQLLLLKQCSQILRCKPDEVPEKVKSVLAQTVSLKEELKSTRDKIEELKNEKRIRKAERQQGEGL